jgi:hypothetical protein
MYAFLVIKRNTINIVYLITYLMQNPHIFAPESPKSGPSTNWRVFIMRRGRPVSRHQVQERSGRQGQRPQELVSDWCNLMTRDRAHLCAGEPV